MNDKIEKAFNDQQIYVLANINKSSKEKAEHLQHKDIQHKDYSKE